MLKKKKTVNDFEKSSLMYFKDISKIMPLSRDEELNLWKEYKNNHNIDARNKLIVSNLKFVANFAQRYKGFGLSYSDLISEGNIGLIKAMDKFDARKGYKAISYSVWWIKQTIIEAITKRNGINGDELPCDYEKQDFSTDDAITPSQQYIDDCFLTLDNNLELQNQEEKNTVSILMGVLTEKEKFVVSKYYGLDEEKSNTLEEIGNIMGITKERVRQINEKALKKLRSEALNKCITNDIYNNKD